MSNPQLVEQIVRDVLQQMQAPGRTAAPAEEPSGDLHIADAVITGERIEQEHTNETRLFVSSKAVLTPSARDAIATLGLKLRRRDSVVNKKVAMTVITNGASAGRMAGDFAGVAAADCQSAADAAIDSVSSGKPAAILADRPEPIAALCNRHEQMKAAVISSVEQLESLRAVWNPNTIVIDPQGTSTYAVKRLLERFAAGGTS